ncbi:hypothetical protein Zmor_002848 [Zophobas morio]|uniref:procollagen-proline 3-dioxygenase n=1 Tax=Zophobas morio TaxID=2755281 RepID=A0AA38M1H2_9CUCU|nr:hypothetical protein Zmor_002848 [Zophobas morio]
MFFLQALKYRVIMTEKQLRGPNRFVSEGLASTEECKTLVNIAKMFAITGDGYEGKRSPHTVMEKFSGFTLNRATLLVYVGLLDPKYLKLYLDLTERAKLRIQEFFQVKKKLYFSYTHLVRRSPLPDSPTNRTDLSHPIHADNCIVLDDNYCKKSSPAYTWRDYSAIIFLNDDFEGGEFIFSADLNAEEVQGVVKPKCGRMVAFSSGFENLHGVRAVTKGSRYGIGVWFTHDSEHAEIERNMAHQVLLTQK